MARPNIHTVRMTVRLRGNKVTGSLSFSSKRGYKGLDTDGRWHGTVRRSTSPLRPGDHPDHAYEAMFAWLKAELGTALCGERYAGA